ncbi:hypothetical protein AV530_006362 [Patagioenas fasciata monilis]|uniref:Uncharacterized protein n=1 Tax=Patagioenas fasciata monilis TaxID=372326 RepID=A0A1V4KI21_PATFA|nr:hypothetical protein AV530_006362 [Patagioenas fasciata monilis]
MPRSWLGQTCSIGKYTRRGYVLAACFLKQHITLSAEEVTSLSEVDITAMFSVLFCSDSTSSLKSSCSGSTIIWCPKPLLSLQPYTHLPDTTTTEK